MLIPINGMFDGYLKKNKKATFSRLLKKYYKKLKKKYEKICLLFNIDPDTQKIF